MLRRIGVRSRRSSAYQPRILARSSICPPVICAQVECGRPRSDADGGKINFCPPVREPRAARAYSAGMERIFERNAGSPSRSTIRPAMSRARFMPCRMPIWSASRRWRGCGAAGCPAGFGWADMLERGDRARARRIAAVAAGRAAAGVPVGRDAQHLRRPCGAARGASRWSTTCPISRRAGRGNLARPGADARGRAGARRGAIGCSPTIRCALKIIAGHRRGPDGARDLPALRHGGTRIRHGAQADAARPAAQRPGRTSDEGLAAACRSRPAFGGAAPRKSSPRPSRRCAISRPRPGRSLAGAAREVRRLIVAATDEQAEGDIVVGRRRVFARALRAAALSSRRLTQPCAADAAPPRRSARSASPAKPRAARASAASSSTGC